MPKAYSLKSSDSYESPLVSESHKGGGRGNNIVPRMDAPPICWWNSGEKTTPGWQLIPSRWWFQIFFIFTPIWGRFPIWLILFKWGHQPAIIYQGFFHIPGGDSLEFWTINRHISPKVPWPQNPGNEVSPSQNWRFLMRENEQGSKHRLVWVI